VLASPWDIEGGDGGFKRESKSTGWAKRSKRLRRSKKGKEFFPGMVLVYFAPGIKKETTPYSGRGEAMKRRISWSLMAALIASVCWMGHVQSAKAEDPLALEVYNPTGAFEITQLHAARLGDLNGKTICELSNDSWQAHRTFPALRELLQRKYPTAKIVPFTEFPQGNTGIDDDKTADLLKQKGCQAAIVGNAG
jgi:hypothetical protein